MSVIVTTFASGLNFPYLIAINIINGEIRNKFCKEILKYLYILFSKFIYLLYI